MDLGQQGQRPESSRADHRADEDRRISRARAPAQQGQRPEEAEERVEGREVGVGEDPRHRQERPARRRARRRRPTAGSLRDDDHADQDREGQRGGEPAREDVQPGRVGPRQSMISNGSPSVEAIPSSQRPSGGCSALSRKTRSTTSRLEEPPALRCAGSRHRSGPGARRAARRSSVPGRRGSARPPDRPPGPRAGPSRRREPVAQSLAGITSRAFAVIVGSTRLSAPGQRRSGGGRGFHGPRMSGPADRDQAGRSDERLPVVAGARARKTDELERLAWPGTRGMLELVRVRSGVPDLGVGFLGLNATAAIRARRPSSARSGGGRARPAVHRRTAS